MTYQEIPINSNGSSFFSALFNTHIRYFTSFQICNKHHIHSAGIIRFIEKENNLIALNRHFDYIYVYI